MSIGENIKHVTALKNAAAERSGRAGDDVLLVAVTKLHSAEEINEAIDCGITDIGENKVQEIMDKYDHVKPVRWHLIGHLLKRRAGGIAAGRIVNADDLFYLHKQCIVAASGKCRRFSALIGEIHSAIALALGKSCIAQALYHVMSARLGNVQLR